MEESKTEGIPGVSLAEFCESMRASCVVAVLPGGNHDRYIHLKDGRIWLTPGYLAGNSRLGIEGVDLPGGWCTPTPGTDAGIRWAKAAPKETPHV